MDALLFPDAPKTVQILPEAVQMGGSWEGNIGRATPLAWESHLVKRVYEFLKPLDSPVLVDVGANTGSYALLGVLLPELYTLALEPNPNVFDVLRRHLQANDLRGRLELRPLALMDREARGTLHLSGATASGCATLGMPVRFAIAEEMTVWQTTLDTIVDGDFDAIHFLKIDTEGAEKFVLQGAKETIAKYKPTMLIECQPMNTAAFGYDPQEIIALVESYGYSVEWASEEDVWATPI